MSKYELLAVSPIDGRYKKQVENLSLYFSEYALIKYRVRMEIEYFIALCNIPLEQLSKFDINKNIGKLREIYENFSTEDAMAIKEIEKITNHDVKAVEYFIKKEFTKNGWDAFSEFVHFGLTSQDINNTSIPLSIKEYVEDVYMPSINNLIGVLKNYVKEWANVPMLAHTHGQPASPTLLGKEINVYVVRIEEQLRQLKFIPFSAKFGGATGNMNAHHVAYPNIDWNRFASEFLDELGLKRSYPTTQIEHYDNLAALFDNFKRINTILIDMARDFWMYISLGYFMQKVKAGEVGSSAMPHKVNPIDFENAEGNLGIANAIFTHLAGKLPISRLQRDLTDSTVLRNVGVPLAHTQISFNSLNKGLGKLILNDEALNADLENNWAVVAEAIQTILRRESYPNPYEALKALTRGHKITKKEIENFIETLNVNEKVKEELKRITPQNYTGA
jgi:adenylosuccinate lyase